MLHWKVTKGNIDAEASLKRWTDIIERLKYKGQVLPAYEDILNWLEEDY